MRFFSSAVTAQEIFLGLSAGTRNRSAPFHSCGDRTAGRTADAHRHRRRPDHYRQHFFLTDGSRLFHQDRAHLRTAVRLGVTSGVFIAAYTVWDSHGVAVLRVPPILYDGGTALTQLILLTPFACLRWPEVTRHWTEHRRYVMGMAVFSPIAYILVLTALSFTPVSYIAPAREVSIIIGTFIGAKYLKESDSRRRLWAAAAMVVGIFALAVG